MKASDEMLIKLTTKHGGNLSAVAQEIGMSPAAVSQRLTRNPDLKNKILDAREKALKQAGISRARVYKTVAEGLEAVKTVSVEDSDSEEGSKVHVTETDFKERRESSKICLQLLRDLEPSDGIKPDGLTVNIQINNLDLNERIEQLAKPGRN